MEETESQRLFRHAFREAVDAVEFWGTGEIDALGSLHDGTGGNIRQSTVDDIRECAARKERMIESGERHGEDMTVAAEALAIVLKTCDNWERDERELEAACAEACLKTILAYVEGAISA